MTDKKLPPLYLRSNADVVPERRFEGDLFDRTKLAEQLTGFLTRMPDGAVIAIDSPWGEGKTWFGKRWCASLQDQGFKTAYIDCFQRDHLEDPFTMIASEFIELARPDQPEIQTKLLDAAKKLGVALLPTAAKFAFNTLGHLALGNAKLSEDVTKSLEALNASAADALEKLVASRLLEYQASNNTIEAFKVSLAEMAVKSGRPVVIFLDELDRCRPDYAVRTIERIKHFFDAPGVIFVLLINRAQLTAAINGLYGQTLNADAYLSKFIPLSLTMPKKTDIERTGEDDNRKYCRAELHRIGIPKTTESQTFVAFFGMLASHFGLSLRDVERAVTLYSFAYSSETSIACLAWPIAIKLAKPDLYKSLSVHDISAHMQARLLASSLAKAATGSTWELQLLEELHRSGEVQFEGSISEEAREKLYSIGSDGRPKGYLSWLFGRIDLTVE